MRRRIRKPLEKRKRSVWQKQNKGWVLTLSGRERSGQLL